MASLSSRFQLIAVCAVVLAAGFGAGGWTYRQEERRVQADLTVAARRCAAAFSADELGALSGTRDDLGGAAYAAIKARLVALKQAQPDVTGIFLVRRSPGAGTAVFLADSEEAFLPGDAFRGDAGMGPKGKDADEGLTCYAVVAAGAQAVDVLGMKIANDPWGGHVPRRVFLSAIYTWLLLGVPAGLVLARRRRGAAGGDALLLAEAVEQSRAAVMITDPEGRIVYGNRRACELAGCGKAEVIGRSWGEFRAPETFAEMMTEVGAGRSWRGEWLNRKKNGESCSVRGLVSPVTDGRGKLLGMLALFQDVTGLKRAEAQAQGEFLATVGHELRTPLNGIVRFAGLLRNTALSPEQRDHVRTIGSNGEALLKLTGNLLDYSWLEAGRMPLDPQPCDVRSLIEGVFELIADQAAAKNLVLRHRLAPEVPVLVEIDAGRLRQVLVNLLGNAVKFTDAGEVSVEVGARTGDRPAGEIMVEFSVRDTGPGIAASDQERLFRPFSQVGRASGRQHGGTGLGLAISRSLVRLMGGDIILESVPGQGSVFRFHVSARPLDATPARAHPQLGLRLLLVDDNAANLRLLQSIAGVLGCECTTAAGGREGFDMIARGERFDAVLLDLQMPEVDGVEVLRRLRAGEAGLEASDLWVTIVTADARAETRSSLFALGCDDFITKPVTVKSCLVALQRVVRHRPPSNR